MIAHRFTIVSPDALPEHLLPDVEHTLAHIGWLGLASERRSVGGLAVIDYRGKVPPLVPTHAEHDHDDMFAQLRASLTALGLACLHTTSPVGTIVLDMDSTLINEEGLDEIAHEVGVGDEVAEITERAMRGELDFAAALRERVALLAGAPTSVLDTVRERLTFTAGAPEFIAAAKAAGCTVGVVSGGFHELIDPMLDVDHVRANRFEIRDGHFTGEVAGPIVDAAAKAASLQSWKRGFAAAIGDGANDIAMIRSADIGIAFDAKPALRESADCVVPMRRLDAVGALLGLL